MQVWVTINRISVYDAAHAYSTLCVYHNRACDDSRRDACNSNGDSDVLSVMESINKASTNKDSH